jgi:hypothetical protein
MPAPLVWLGAAAVSLYATNKLNTAHLRKKNVLARMPGYCIDAVKPRNGSIVTCDIFEMFEHTGIWINGNIFELNGNGLVRCISPSRFIQNRSGDKIYVACDLQGNPLVEPLAIERTKSQLYNLYDYHLIKQNCHRFVAEMIAGNRQNITSFSDLNEFLSSHFNTAIDWRLT